jgi:predicted RND superfamily exporter protein
MLKLPIKVEKAEDWTWMGLYKEEVEQLIDEHLESSGGVKATVSGESYQRFVYVNAMTDSFQNSIYIAIVACLAVLYIVFRDVRLSLLTITPVVAVSLWLYAGINLAGQSLNLVTLQVASLAIGLGLDYAIHVTQAIREQKKRRPDEGMERWVRGMMGHTGTALFASGFTDILGFGVLLLSVMPMFSMFGKVMIAMVILAQAACVFILPALLTMFGGLESDTSESSS